MNRLQQEVRRLYLPPLPPGEDASTDEAAMVDAQGRVRAMVLQLSRPADWQALAKVWNGVQIELELPAPAIAISGTDGYQLWFSLQQALPAAQAQAFLDALRQHYLGDVKPQRVSLWPAPDNTAPRQARHAEPVPALQAGGTVWSAFVAPDLAPVFADEPWLDMPPNPLGQAELLSKLASTAPDDLQRALQQLAPARAPAAAPPVQQPPSLPAAAATVAGAGQDPKAFLLDIMNNDTVDLALRIEAARSLLPYFEVPRR
jgi:hypothetical protein